MLLRCNFRFGGVIVFAHCGYLSGSAISDRNSELPTESETSNFASCLPQLLGTDGYDSETKFRSRSVIRSSDPILPIRSDIRNEQNFLPYRIESYTAAAYVHEDIHLERFVASMSQNLAAAWKRPRRVFSERANSAGHCRHMPTYMWVTPNFAKNPNFALDLR